MLRQLYLKLAFPGFGPPGEDIEYQRRAVYDLSTKGILKVPLLAGQQLIVKNDCIVRVLLSQINQLVELSLA